MRPQRPSGVSLDACQPGFGVCNQRAGKAVQECGGFSFVVKDREWRALYPCRRFLISDLLGVCPLCRRVSSVALARRLDLPCNNSGEWQWCCAKGMPSGPSPPPLRCFCSSRSGLISDLAMVSARLELKSSLQLVRGSLLMWTKRIYIRSPRKWWMAVRFPIEMTLGCRCRCTDLCIHALLLASPGNPSRLWKWALIIAF